ncbi:MAG TPA: ATP citrate synthase [Elusimicrobia bacterium]|nr:MAG: ATP citrate synthase [Elusimicrobia bacterium GWF2_62_30]HBA61556.1 ATP citrate synthase [Elusimicrobiota bacterium]
MMKPELFTKDTTAIVYGYHVNAIQRMLDFDYAAGRKVPSVAAIVNPGSEGVHKVFFGKGEVLLPVYRNFETAAEKHPKADVVVNFASYRSAFESSMEALHHPNIRTVCVIAEGVPERRARILAATAAKLDKMVIGPATVGGIKAGCFKIANTAGTYENIVESKLHRPGSVGFVSKSGGLSNECYNIIARNTDGLYEGIAIGGDSYPGSTLLQHILRYEAIPAVKMIVALGEIGGTEELRIVEALKAKKITKPLVIWVTGTCSKMFPAGVQFGHAGAKAGSDLETADAKNAALKAAGAIVPDSFDDYGVKINETYAKLVKKGAIKPAAEVAAPVLPMDFAQAMKEGKIRKATTFINTISNEKKEELEYLNMPISKVLESNMGIGGVIGLLWFKRDLPEYGRKFLETALMLTADHGPAVSGAHNAIVAARAGKDIISSLASGLLTIGPRFGGAIDGAAQQFKRAYDAGLTPEQFIKDMKAKGINVPGIGHKVKSLTNPDMRVTQLKAFCKKNFKKTGLLDYALEVEQLTTKKKANLILNVDGCIGIAFVDMLNSTGAFTREEIDNIVNMGCLNALFVVGRSIGIFGHIFDQKRLKQPLYRTPYDEIAYMTDL